MDNLDFLESCNDLGLLAREMGRIDPSFKIDHTGPRGGLGPNGGIFEIRAYQSRFREINTQRKAIATQPSAAAQRELSARCNAKYNALIELRGRHHGGFDGAYAIINPHADIADDLKSLRPPPDGGDLIYLRQIEDLHHALANYENWCQLPADERQRQLVVALANRLLTLEATVAKLQSTVAAKQTEALP